MNGKYQVGSGRIVTFTHDKPFINTSIPDIAEKINTSDGKRSEKNSEGRSSLSATEQREEPARAFEELAVTDGEKLSDKQLNIRGKI